MDISGAKDELIGIRLLLADDNAVVRAAVRSLIDAQKDIHVVAEACDGKEAVALARAHQPHVILMDIEMPVLNGIEATRRIVTENNEVMVLAYSATTSSQVISQALEAGASHFVEKSASANELLRSIRAVAWCP